MNLFSERFVELLEKALEIVNAHTWIYLQNSEVLLSPMETPDPCVRCTRRYDCTFTRSGTQVCGGRWRWARRKEDAVAQQELDKLRSILVQERKPNLQQTRMEILMDD